MAKKRWNKVDWNTLQKLAKLGSFSYVLKDDVCTEISFFDENSIFEGTIRHSNHKADIVKLIACLKGLQKLNLRKCKLGQLSDLNLPNLVELDISCNDLEFVPTWIYDLPLKKLNLGANKIQEIKSIANTLEEFKIHKNRISCLPPLPKSLKSLNIFFNQIQEFPELDLPLLEFISFGVSNTSHCPPLPSKLKWLSIAVSNISQVPSNFCSLPLKGVRIIKSKINSLPEDIGQMQIEELFLYKNNISILPDSFYDLPLKRLNLTGNSLKDPIRVKNRFKDIEFFELDDTL